MVTRMQDEIDPQLLALFAESNETLASEAFLKTFLARLQRAQRLRTLQLTGLIVVLLLIGAWFAPSVLEHTAAAMRVASEYSVPYERLVVSPLGWALSTLVGLAVLFRVGALRRR
jgi:hypothetical protein